MKKARVVDDRLRRRLELSGLKIAYYRKRRGMTQDQLAEVADMSRSFLARVEACNGTPPLVPPIDFYYKLADILGISIIRLFEDEDT